MALTTLRRRRTKHATMHAHRGSGHTRRRGSQVGSGAGIKLVSSRPGNCAAGLRRRAFIVAGSVR